MAHTPQQPGEALTVASQESSYAPAVGELVWDTAAKRLGQVMDDKWSRYQLRPPGGGIEWNAAPSDVHPIGQAPRPSCTECKRIKDQRAKAAQAGDRELAESWAVAFGRHHRHAH